jgi:hypothetical protein
MTLPISDTHPDAERVQIDLLRKAPAWRKLELVGQLNAALRTLALSGLQQRHPNSSPEALHRMLADLILGETLAVKVYGEKSHAR